MDSSRAHGSATLASLGPSSRASGDVDDEGEKGEQSAETTQYEDDEGEYDGAYEYDDDEDAAYDEQHDGDGAERGEET